MKASPPNTESIKQPALMVAGSPRSSIKVRKQRVEGARALPPEMDFLAIEDPLEIELCWEDAAKTAKRHRVVTLRTPGHDLDLIHGFLFCEGSIQCATDILEVVFHRPRAEAAPTQARVHLRTGQETPKTIRERAGAVHASCGACGSSRISALALPPELRIHAAITVEAAWIHDLPALMNGEQATFRQTGGLHAAAIFSSDGTLLAAREDIGRHNALDKAIGANLIAGESPSRGQVLCVSGRMSYDILQKAIVARIPIVAGVGAPSSLAVSMANDFNLTLLGFVRNGSYNIYSCPERLRFANPQ